MGSSTAQNRGAWPLAEKGTRGRGTAEVSPLRKGSGQGAQPEGKQSLWRQLLRPGCLKLLCLEYFLFWGFCFFFFFLANNPGSAI